MYDKAKSAKKFAKNKEIIKNQSEREFVNNKKNGNKYPRKVVVSDFTRNDYAGLYKMFDDFKKDFYGTDEFVGGSQVNFPAFKSLFPILVFDLTKQSEIVKTGAINMRVTLNYAVAPANISAHALIISYRLFVITKIIETP